MNDQVTVAHECEHGSGCFMALYIPWVICAVYTEVESSYSYLGVSSPPPPVLSTFVAMSPDHVLGFCDYVGKPYIE